MTTPSRHRPSSSMVVAMIALFVAIGGTALALPGKNTVNSGDVKDETLKSQDLKDEQAVASSDVIDNTLQSEDVNDGTLQSQDYDNSSVLSEDIATDAVGVSEITSGAVGSNEILDGAVTGTEIDETTLGPVPTLSTGAVDINTNTVSVPGGSQDDSNGNGVSRAQSVQCEPGMQAVGGGAYWDSNVNAQSDELENRIHSAAFINNTGIAISSTSAVATGFFARGEVDQDGDHRLVVQVLCVRVG